jgi:3-methyladenine DNA glycosylase AlkD
MQTTKEISDGIIAQMSAMRNETNRKGMARFGINVENAFGMSMPVLREMAKKHKGQHELALELWKSGYHEARILATLVDDKNKVTEDQMEQWVRDFDSWDVCDQCCQNLFGHTVFAFQKADEWSRREEEFVKRAGFTVMARLAIGNKEEDDELFIPFFERITEESTDSRNFVKKAVNWALRQTGKRSFYLREKALACSEILMHSASPAARWIAADAIRELNSEKIVQRIKR